VRKKEKEKKKEEEEEKKKKKRVWRRMKNRHWEMLSAEEFQVLINTVCCGTYIIVGPGVSLEEITIFTASLVHIAIQQKDR